jgi:dihydroorotase
LQNLTENDKIDEKQIWEVNIMTILLKNGNVIDYASRTNKKMDILVEDRKIIKVADQINEVADKTIDCTGLIVIPGMIDMHCHLRQPGFEYKETIETGSKSAVKGGFTTICPMPNTKPTPDSAIILEEILKEAERVNLCNVFPYSSVTKGEKGEELVNFEEMKKAGAIAFSDDGMPVVNAKIMREAMIKADEQNTFVASHCEEKSVSAGAINAGPIAEKLGVEGVLPEAEEIMVAREIVISETNKVRGHICHISTETSVAMIRDAKKRGVKITCETCPHYFSLTVNDVLEAGTNAKMNPPLREEKDRQAIIKGLQDGTIDAIITDHAPHSEEEKLKPLSQAPNGIIGFETALAASITYLIETKCISYLDLVRLTSYTPAQLLHLETKGRLKEGYDADITIFDPNIEYVYTKESIVSKSKNTPFIGKKLKGRVMYTIVGGKIVYEK